MLTEVSHGVAVLLSSTTWLVVSVVIGWWGAHWPADRLTSEGPITTIRGWEHHGRWWQRHLRVRAWKDRVPEAGGVFGGYAKRHLPSNSSEGLELFRRETIRAERVHWLILASTPLHAVWCGPGLFAAMVVFGVAFTVPFIVIQRSNRGRLDLLLDRRRAHRARASRPEPRPPRQTAPPAVA